jgi:UDP:flavonoid glycosyltransferase YjiC (YdhE family)
VEQKASAWCCHGQVRLIFTTWAWPSHLYAMVPLAWACRAAGHEVLVASQPELTGAIAGTGLPAAPVGHDLDVVAVFRDIARSRNIAGPRAPAPGTDGPRVLGLLAALAEAMVDDLIELAMSWRPDIVVFEPTAFAGPLAAAAVGIPAVRHLYGTDLMSAVGRFLPRMLGPVSERLGLDAVDPYGEATVDPCPGAIQVQVGSRRLPMRFVPHNGPGALPAEVVPRSRRPRVCITWGTTLSRLDPRLFLAGPVSRAVSGLDAEVVTAVTPAQRALLGWLPASVRVIDSVPLHLLLPSCDLVISHGGAGTLLTAASYGLPQLLIPRLPDHVRHAARLAQAGAGAVLSPEADHAVISDQAATMLASSGYRAAAHELRREMQEQPPPAELVPDLERLALGAPSRPVSPRAPTTPPVNQNVMERRRILDEITGPPA